MARTTATIIAMALTLCAASGGASAAASPPEDLIFAYGSLSCTNWTHPTKFVGDHLHDWVVAGVSRQIAASHYRSEIAADATPAQMFAWIDGFCAQRPLSGLAVAVVELVNSLAAHWSDNRK